MSVSIEVIGEVVMAHLEGELDHHSAKEMREAIDIAVERNAPTLLVLDFQDVSFMDSSGIGLVMGRYRNLKKFNTELQIINTSTYIYKVMKLAGLERLAKIEKKGVAVNEGAE